MKVTGVSPNARKEHVEELFSQYADVKSVECVYDPTRKQHIGIALVHLQSESGAKEAMKYLDGVCAGIVLSNRTGSIRWQSIECGGS